jgi:hypothetical protein
VKRTLRVASIIIGIPLALFMTWFTIVQYQDWRYIHPWERIQRRDTEQHVIELLGEPHRVIVERRTDATWESPQKIEDYGAESVKQYRYIPFSITGEEYGLASTPLDARCQSFILRRHERSNQSLEPTAGRREAYF